MDRVTRIRSMVAFGYALAILGLPVLEATSKVKIRRSRARVNQALIQTGQVTTPVPATTIVPIGGISASNLSKLRSFEDIVRVRLGVADFYLITNPDLIEEVLVTKQRDFIKGEFLQRTKKVFGEGLLTSEGDFHHRERRLAQPAFHHDRIESYCRTMVEYSNDLTSHWRDEEVIDAHTEMEKLTMRVVAKCLFNSDIQSESNKIVNDLTLMIGYFSRLSSPFASILQHVPLVERKYVSALDRTNKMMDDLIDMRRRSGKDEGDLLSMLLHAKDEAGLGMSDRQLRDEVLISFAAGWETISNALTWTWYLLSQNPQVESKMLMEIDAILGMGTVPNLKDIAKLEYTRNVFTESMRMYPPVWVLVRQALNDCVVGRYLIPRGSSVVMSQFMTHRDPRFFENPEAFNPERWTPALKQKIPKFAYFPFGGGPRGCIGEPFAWMEGVLLLASISRRWRMNHVKTHRVEMHPRITLRPRYGMMMQLVDRSNA